MNRKFLVEVKVKDEIEGGALDVLMRLAKELEKMQEDQIVEDYGVALLHDATWFVKTAADLDKKLEGAGE